MPAVSTTPPSVKRSPPRPSWWRSLLLLATLLAHTVLDLPPLIPPPPPAPSERVSFNVIITTIGRESLGGMLASVGPQLTADDFITVISDTDPNDAPRQARVRADVGATVCNNCTVRLIENAIPLGGSGHNSRTRHQYSLPGAFHMNADDDDIYTPDAFSIIRAVVGGSLARRVYIFRIIKLNVFRSKGRNAVFVMPLFTTTTPEEVGVGNVGTPCGVYRNIPSLIPAWNASYGGDGLFYEALIRNFGAHRTVLVPRVIYIIPTPMLNLYDAIRGFGLDQPAGTFFLDKNGRVLPDGVDSSAAPTLNGVLVLPNPLLSVPQT